MDLEDRGAFGLGRVCGQNGFDTHEIQLVGNLHIGQAEGLESVQVLGPEARDLFQLAFVFKLAPHLHRRVFLHHVEELKGHGVSLSRTPRLLNTYRRLLTIAPE